MGKTKFRLQPHPEGIEESEYIFKCGDCGEGIKGESNLTTHAKIHKANSISVDLTFNRVAYRRNHVG